jgi:hypothetical protein
MQRQLGFHIPIETDTALAGTFFTRFMSCTSAHGKRGATIETGSRYRRFYPV